MTQSAALSPTLARLAYLDTQNHVPVLARVAVTAAAVITLWSVRAKTRAALKSLDPSLLNDVGLTADRADHEASKPFWQP